MKSTLQGGINHGLEIEVEHALTEIQVPLPPQNPFNGNEVIKYETYELIYDRPGPLLYRLAFGQSNLDQKSGAVIGEH